MSTFVPVAVCVCVLACTLPAQSPGSSAYNHRRTAADASAKRNAEDSVSGTWGLDFTTAYFFRGLRLEDRGLITQPHFEINYTLADDGEDVRTVDLILGVWNSLHEGPTGTGGGNTLWYESDFYWGLGFGIGERWSASATYSYYASPNGSFSTAEELVFGVAFDDAGMWDDGFTGLRPAATLGIEIAGQADGGVDRGIYVQAAVEPIVQLGATGDLQWTLALPAAIGLSLANYYEDASGDDNPLGFLDVGAVVSTPVPAIPSRFGPWTMTFSLHALLLGSTPKEQNRGDAFEWIGAFGLSTTF